MKEEEDPLNELYRKILHGTARPGEKEHLAKWLAGLNIDREEISPEELAAEREQSQHEMRERFFQKRRSITLIRPLMVAASVAAVIIGSVLFYNIQSNRPTKQAAVFATSITKPGERKSIILGDGSKIWINSATTVRYPVSFKGRTREIFLEGQAYFEISHDRSRPFIVHTGKMAVQVLGTTFDVCNYADDSQAAVTVATGKVGVKTSAATGSRMLTPGEQLVYDKKTGLAEERSVNPADYIEWQKGAQVFRNKELQEICKLLERSYGVKILIQTPALETKKLNFRIKGGENITRIVEMLSATGDFRFAVKARNITLWK